MRKRRSRRAPPASAASSPTGRPTASAISASGPANRTSGEEQAMGRLEGKSIVVTGAARGLGEAYARAAVAEGAAVVINDIDAEPADALVAELCGAGGRVVAHNGDVSAWDFAESLIA